jgi:DNA-binding winged helix-turn-helix (wHTH) protein
MHAQGYGVYEFGPFRLDPEERMLMDKGQAVALTPKGLDLLLALVRNAGHVVGKEELMREIWPDTFVEENNLTVNISALRKLLGEGASDQRYIQTGAAQGLPLCCECAPVRGFGAAWSARQRNR